jgi:hypothetical protein
MLFMEKLIDEIAHVGYPFQKNSEDADNDRILLERIHNHIDD